MRWKASPVATYLIAFEIATKSLWLHPEIIYSWLRWVNRVRKVVDFIGHLRVKKTYRETYLIKLLLLWKIATWHCDYWINYFKRTSMFLFYHVYYYVNYLSIFSFYFLIYPISNLRRITESFWNYNKVKQSYYFFFEKNFHIFYIFYKV